MKKIFTFICLAVMALSVSAKDVTINCAGISLPYAQDGVTIAAGENVSTVAGGIKLAGKKEATLIISADVNITNIVVTGTNLATSGEGWDEAGNWAGEAKSVTLVNNSTALAGSTISQIVVTIAGGDGPAGKPEKYVAISWDNETKVYTVAPEFAAVVADPAAGGIATNAEDGASIVKFGTKNIEALAVGGTTAVNGNDPTGPTEWNDIKWDWKNQGDILFGYIAGTGNPVFGYDWEEIMTDGVGTGTFRPNYDPYYYTPDCGELPAQGLYYQFTAKVKGLLKMGIWANKGNRNTYLIDSETTEPVKYRAEGYINGQNGEDGKKRWLSTEEIQEIHNNAKVGADGVDSAPYVIGAGNQPFWGNVVFDIEEGQTVLLFHHSAQIGFQGFEFTPGAIDTGIANVTAVKANTVAVRKMMQNGKLVIVNGASEFNVAGQRMK